MPAPPRADALLSARRSFAVRGPAGWLCPNHAGVGYLAWLRGMGAALRMATETCADAHSARAMGYPSAAYLYVRSCAYSRARIRVRVCLRACF